MYSPRKKSWHWWVAVSHKMDLKEIRSSDFVINLDTLHFFWPILIFRTENALGRRGPSPTNDKGVLKVKTTKNFFHFFIGAIHLECEARGLPFSRKYLLQNLQMKWTNNGLVTRDFRIFNSAVHKYYYFLLFIKRIHGFRVSSTLNFNKESTFFF